MPVRPMTHRQRKPLPRRHDYDANRGTPSERGYGPAWQVVRQRILIRDGYQCQLCGALVGRRKRDAHVDHIVPRARGGTDEPSNLRTLCHSCHSAKTAREDRGFGRGDGTS